MSIHYVREILQLEFPEGPVVKRLSELQTIFTELENDSRGLKNINFFIEDEYLDSYSCSSHRGTTSWGIEYLRPETAQEKKRRLKQAKRRKVVAEKLAAEAKEKRHKEYEKLKKEFNE